MSTYNAGTMEIINKLGETDLQIAENMGNIELRLDRAHFLKVLPKYCDQATNVITAPQKPGERRFQLAKRYGVDAAILSRVTAENGVKASRNLVLCALLGLDPLPNIDEVNHSLMMMCCAGLFTETVYLGENRRNWILAQIFQYGQTNPCPMDSWQDFANTVLTFCNMELISKKFNFYSFPTALEDLVEEWQETLRTINATDYAPIRQAYLDRYREAQNLAYRGGLTRAYYRLADTVHVGEDRIKALFGRTTYRNSRGGREVLIALGIALGCTLRETNRMLLQINEPLLYPNLSDQKEIQYVQQLRQNETQRKY